MRKLPIFILFVLFLNISLKSQSAVSEYNKTILAYKEAKEFAFDVDVYAYENKTDKTAELVGSGKAMKKEGFFYSRFAEREMLISPEISLVINHDQKTIECYPYDFAKKQKALKMDMTNPVDSATIKSDTSFVYYGLNDGRKHFSYKSPGQAIIQTDIYVNPTNNLISKVIYTYGESTEDYELGVSTVVIYYKNVMIKNIPGKSFAPERYVSKKGTDFIASSNYKGFKVVTHKNNKKTS